MGLGTRLQIGRLVEQWLHDVVLFYWVVQYLRLLTQHNQGIAQWSLDPFPHERVGSGHKTTPIPKALYQLFQIFKIEVVIISI